MAQTASGTVDIEKVKTVARNYCLKTEKKYAKATADDINLTLVETKKSDDAVLYYIFDIGYHGNDGKGDGYIIMSASYDQPPVIGYIPEGRYDAARAAMNTAFTDWMNSFADQIEYSIKNKKKSSVYQEQWGAYLTKGKMDSESMILNLTSKWNQTAYFNLYSPEATGSNGHPSSGSSFGFRCPTGCVATAMGQIMYYYQWPQNILGHHSYYDAVNDINNLNSRCTYDDPSYDSLRFTSNLACNWGGMVDQPSDANDDISKLLYNCAVSVDMDFAYCQSWTNTSQAVPAYSTYFGYNTNAQYIEKINYSEAAWESIIIDQIRNEKPVHYRGTGGGGGHSFICYGYKIESGGNQFYFNWGWGGSGDGYFALSGISYSTGQAAIINIAPTSQPNLSFTAASVEVNPVYTGVNNTVDFTLTNSGTRSAGSSTTAIYLSTDQTLDQSDMLLATLDVTSLSASQSTNKSANIVVDVGTPGTYYILVEADTDHKVHESNETDNVTAIPITVNISTAMPGEFRSAASGNWNTASTWQYYDGSNWVAASGFPISTSGKITIRNNHTVTVNTSLSADQVTVMTGGEVDIASGYTLTIPDGSDDIDFEVAGKMVNSGTVTANGKLYFGGGAVYQHSGNGGTIPTATWDATSTCLITGITTNALTGFGQSFGNLTWNCAYQTIEVPINSDISIKGNFTLTSTGSGMLSVTNNATSRTIYVFGNYSQTGGHFDFSTSSASAPSYLYVSGDFTHTATAGSIYVSGDAYNGIVVFNGSTLQTLKFASLIGAEWVSYVVNAGSNVSLASDIKLTGDTYSSKYYSDFTVNGTLNVGTYTITSLNSGSHFYLNSGATLSTANTSTSGALASSGNSYGSIQVSGTRTYSAGANYVFNGTTNQYTGNGLPSNLTGSIYINNSGMSGSNSVNLNTTQTIANGGSVNILNGVFSVGTYLSMAATSSIYRLGGSMTGTLQGTGKYNLYYSGISMNTTTEISGNGINDINVALIPGQTLTLTQSVSPSGNLAVTSGTLDLGSYTLNKPSSGGTLSIADGATLKIGSTYSIPTNYAGHSFASGSTVEYYGADQTITPETGTGYGNLTLSGTGTKLIAAGAAVTVQSGLTTSDKLTIMSDSLGNNGSLIVRGSTAGKVTYKRQLHRGPYGDYYYFSSPVVSNSDANTATVTYVWSWDEPGGVWHVETGRTTGLGSCIGYNLAQNKTGNGLITFTGSMADNYSINATSPYADTINSGYIDYLHRTFTDGTNHSPTARSLSNYGGGGWNLLGNPYTSALNVLAFIAANNGSGGGQNNFDPNYEAVYLYDGSKPPHGKYYYISVSDGWGDKLTGATAIQAGQGFFVAAMNDNSTFVFNKNMQVHNTVVLMLKSTKPQNPWPGVELSATLGESTDATRVILDDNMSFDLDPGYDVGQMSTGMDIEIYTSLVNDNGRYFTRQAIPLTDPDQVTIPVGINCKKGGTVTFSAKTVDLGHYKFYLEDRATGITTDLNTGSYTAVIPAKTYGTGRFYLITSYSARRYEDPEKQPATDISGLRIWTTDNKVIISGEVSADALFSLYDLSGRKIVETRLNDQNYNTVDIPSGAKGIFIAVVKDGSGTLKSKIAVP